MTLFKGTGVAVITPFTETREPDFPALRKIIAHLIAGKVDYLVVLGTTGESATLEPDEKIRVIETFFEANNGTLPIVLGVGGNHTGSVCRTLESWQKRFSPDGILSVSPYYNKPSQEGIYRHYGALAASTDLPLILYNVPGRTSSNIAASTVLRLAHEFSNIAAVKEASGNFEQGMEIVAGRPEGFLVISGDDILTLPLIGAGYDGVISVTANALPAEFSGMTRLALAGKMNEARSIHYRILKLMQLNFAEGNPAGVKALMHALDLCMPYVRLPLVEATERLIGDIKKELATERLPNS
jgi:4-hydroxy-tetrahydrodipicolinate synthase